MGSEEIQHTEPNILMVKGRFKATSLNLYGQFIVIFTSDKRFDSYNSVVSTFSDLYDLEPHEEWTKYLEIIAQSKWQGNFNANMTTSLMDQFKKFSEEMNSIQLLYDNVYEYDYNSLDITLFDLINRIVHDKNLILETAIQEVLPSDFKEAKKNVGKSDSKEGVKIVGKTETFTVDEGSVILPVKPMVSPVKGKPIYELRIGDRLMVRIQPNSDRANYFIDYLDLRVENEVKPTPAEVIDIKAGSSKNDPIDILTLVSPGLYGKFTEEEKQVKLRIYDPSIDGPLLKKKSEKAGTPEEIELLESAETTGFSKSTLIMLALFALILTLFVVLIFLSW